MRNILTYSLYNTKLIYSYLHLYCYESMIDYICRTVDEYLWFISTGNDFMHAHFIPQFVRGEDREV